MIFQHTAGLIYSGKKTATTRIWKDHYFAVLDAIKADGNTLYYVGSRNTQKRLYYVGQKHSVQSGRGIKGHGKIEILSLQKVLVYHMIDDPEFIRREGFDNKAEFLKLWRQMHGANYLALHIRFKFLGFNS